MFRDLVVIVMFQIETEICSLRDLFDLLHAASCPQGNDIIQFVQNIFENLVQRLLLIQGSAAMFMNRRMLYIVTAMNRSNLRVILAKLKMQKAPRSRG